MLDWQIVSREWNAVTMCSPTNVHTEVSVVPVPIAHCTHSRELVLEWGRVSCVLGSHTAPDSTVLLQYPIHAMGARRLTTVAQSGGKSLTFTQLRILGNTCSH